MHIVLRIIGLPVPKGRPRSFRVGGFLGHYTPKRTAEWEKYVRLQARQQYKQAPLDCPIKIEVEFYLPRPKSLPKKYVYHAKKPDLDNLNKAILDSLEGIIYTNDSRICQIVSRKNYASSRSEVGVVIRITAVT